MFKKQGTSKRSASTSIGDREPGFHEATPTDMGEQASACDMAWAFEELEHCEELSEVQLATVVGGWGCGCWQPPIRGIRAFPAAYASLAGVDVTRIRHL